MPGLMRWSSAGVEGVGGEEKRKAPLSSPDEEKDGSVTFCERTLDDGEASRLDWTDGSVI